MFRDAPDWLVQSRLFTSMISSLENQKNPSTRACALPETNGTDARVPDDHKVRPFESPFPHKQPNKQETHHGVICDCRRGRSSKCLIEEDVDDEAIWIAGAAPKEKKRHGDNEDTFQTCDVMWCVLLLEQSERAKRDKGFGQKSPAASLWSSSRLRFSLGSTTRRNKAEDKDDRPAHLLDYLLPATHFYTTAG